MSRRRAHHSGRHCNWLQWLLICGLLAPSHSQADTLNIVVDNITPGKGTILLQIMANPEQFKDQSPAAAALSAPAQTASVRLTHDLPPGDYAIRVMHDVNDNGKLDSNFVGIPKEPWAFSNNAVGRMGPPRWSAASFKLAGETTQTISLHK